MENDDLSQQMNPPADDRLVLLTGATGYIGGALLKRLEKANVRVRCLARSSGRLTEVAPTTEVVAVDLYDGKSLSDALCEVHTAYYLIHSMTSSANFEKEDRELARAFGQAAKQAGVKRIIYLGGLGDEQDKGLSPHLRSRHEVGAILAESGVETIEFRASAVIGAGSLSFEMIRTLTNRLPIMICPRWLSTLTQPIAVSDLLDYLVQALWLESSGSRVFEIGGSDQVTYGGLILQYARQKGLKRWLISVPLLTPRLSGMWLGLVTPATAEVGRHLIEGLRNPTTVCNNDALSVFSVRPMGTEEAIRQALTSEA